MLLLKFSLSSPGETNDDVVAMVPGVAAPNSSRDKEVDFLRSFDVVPSKPLSMETVLGMGDENESGGNSCFCSCSRTIVLEY